MSHAVTRIVVALRTSFVGPAISYRTVEPLKLGEGGEVALQYYEMGRTVGGPVLPALEKKLGLPER